MLRLKHTAHVGCSARTLAFIVAALAIQACTSSRPLMPVPRIYTHGVERAFNDDLPDELKTPNVHIVYATDRLPLNQEDGRVHYGAGRDRSLALGEAVVNIGGNTRWRELVTDTESRARKRAFRLRVRSVVEKARTPNYPLPYSMINGRAVTKTDFVDRENQVKTIAHRLLRKQLSLRPRKELLVFVHGVGSSFEDALYTTAEISHFMGREFVPIAYSWPAGRGGIVRGYAHDRESSESTVIHFRRLLEWLGGLPDVDGIHLIAHSRGSYVTLAALRELAIATRARGERLQDRYKLRNVILAAPDINADIGLQRTTDERVNLLSNRWTTYTSSGDSAIGISEFLFKSERFGRVRFENFDDEARKIADEIAGLFSRSDANVEYKGRLGGSFGHSYFRTNPAVSSDLVLAVRFGRDPGAEHGRPLTHIGSIFWKIDDSYMGNPR